jgi:hypothetical protein
MNALTAAPSTSNFEAPFNKDKFRFDSREIYSPAATASEQSTPSILRLLRDVESEPPSATKSSDDFTPGNRASSASLDQSMLVSLHYTAREIERRVESKLASVCAAEFDRMRDWFDEKGLPKIGRVAQRETYRLLEKNAFAREESERLKRELSVGANVRTIERGNHDSSVDSSTTTPVVTAAIPTSDAEVLWSRVRRELSAELAVEAISAWLDPLRAVAVQERTLILNVPDGFEISWISNQYIDAINRTLSKLNSTVCQAQIVTSGLV